MNNIINIKLSGVENSAWVTQIPNRQHNMFRVVFENGYENIFFTDVETGKWVEEDLGFTFLALKIGDQLKNFVKNFIHVPKLLIWHTQSSNDQLVSFGFFNFMKNKHKMYEIYHANKKYMYTLLELENDEWQILGNNSNALKNLDALFLEQVIHILPLYSAKAG